MTSSDYEDTPRRIEAIVHGPQAESRRRAGTWRTVAVALAGIGVAVALAACGDDDDDPAPGAIPSSKGSFTRVVSFGDSLSDAGTYAPATSVTGNGAPPYIGGRFTTNSDQAKVWVEVLASELGLAATPAVVGFGTQAAACPIATTNPSLAQSCTLYGQGGARVTSVDGIGKSGGALTEPLKAQIDRHLAKFTSFTAADLVLIYGGNNDVFVQLGSFTEAAAGIAARVALGSLSTAEGQAETAAAQAAAQSAMKTAAQELATYIRDSVVAKGARYVAVMTLPDSVKTPFGQALPTDVQTVLTGLSEAFNTELRTAIAGQPVAIVDTRALAADVYANPAAAGFTNGTGRACDAAKILAITQGAVADGSSLFCNATPGSPLNGLTDEASVDTWLFADSVHPTTGGHRKISEQIKTKLAELNWL